MRLPRRYPVVGIWVVSLECLSGKSSPLTAGTVWRAGGHPTGYSTDLPFAGMYW